MKTKREAALRAQTRPQGKEPMNSIAAAAAVVKGGKPPTQQELILRHLEEYGSITSLEAVELYGIMRLASRVSELRQDGHLIESTAESCRNRYGVNTAYVRYTLEGGRSHV